MSLHKKSLKAQLQHISDDSKKIGDLQYQLDGTVTKLRQAQKAVESVQSQLDTLRATFYSFHQSLPNSTKHMGADVTDSFSCFLPELLQEVRQLIKKQRATVKLTVKTGLKTAYAFFRSLESKLSLTGPSFLYR